MKTTSGTDNKSDGRTQTVGLPPTPEQLDPPKQIPGPEAFKGEAPATYQVRFTTSKGTFDVEVTRAWSPNGADRFYHLVKAGFYDDCRFFRVISGFMAQTGINGNPRAQAKWRDANIQDDPVKVGNTRGHVTFAKTGRPNSRSTQFFISYRDNSQLDADGFSSFGKVMGDGMNVVDKLFAGYGEGAPSGRGPDQGSIQKRGNDYLNENFPRLDYIKTAKIIEKEAKTK